MEPLFVLRLVARAWALPPAGLLVVALAGVWLAGRRPALGRGLAAAAIVALLALSLGVVADPLQRYVERYPPLDPTAPLDAQAIVVLGGASRPALGPGVPAEPMPLSLERLAKGVELARRTGLPMLLSGGTVVRGPPEAETMQGALRRYFAIEARWLETGSRTTGENARYSAEILHGAGVRRIVLVTSASHMHRAVLEFTAAGLEVVPAPAGTSAARYDGWEDWLPSAGTFERSCRTVHELVGIWLTAPRAATSAVR